MDSTTIIILAVSAVIYLFIVYQLIKNASYGRKIWVESQKQTELLANIARKHGVDETDITTTLSDFRYK